MKDLNVLEQFDSRVKALKGDMLKMRASELQKYIADSEALGDVERSRAALLELMEVKRLKEQLESA